jgi:hypothetical protein
MGQRRHTVESRERGHHGGFACCLSRLANKWAICHLLLLTIQSGAIFGPFCLERLNCGIVEQHKLPRAGVDCRGGGTDGVGRLVAHFRSRSGNIYALGTLQPRAFCVVALHGLPYSSFVASERHLHTSVTLSLPLSEPEILEQGTWPS